MLPLYPSILLGAEKHDLWCIMPLLVKIFAHSEFINLVPLSLRITCTFFPYYIFTKLRKPSKALVVCVLSFSMYIQVDLLISSSMVSIYRAPSIEDCLYGPHRLMCTNWNKTLKWALLLLKDNLCYVDTWQTSHLETLLYSPASSIWFTTFLEACPNLQCHR